MKQIPVPPAARTNYLRRSLGVAICLGPAILLLVSLVYGLLSAHDRVSGAALGIALGGLLVALSNAYLSWGRGRLYRWRHGGMDGYRNVSVLPGIGTALATLAATWGFGDRYTAIVGLVVLVMDTGGLPWFLVATWRDRGLWDDETNGKLHEHSRR
jgi:hypothetical protein